VGRKFQYGKQLHWDEFYKYLKMWQNGEKNALNLVLRDVIAAQCIHLGWYGIERNWFSRFPAHR
jgi:hypothetical protein